MRAALKTNGRVHPTSVLAALVCVAWSAYGVIVLDAQEAPGGPTPAGAPQAVTTQATPGGRGA
jgi:hypothetical protein